MSVRKIRNSWWVDFRHEGVRYRKRSPENSRRGAEAYEAVLRGRLAQGKELDGPKAAPAFDAFAEEWLDTYVKPNLKPSTVNRWSLVVRNRLVPFFNRRDLDAIDALAIERYKAMRSATGVAAVTVNHELNVLGRMLRVAVEWGRLMHAPRFKKLREAPPSLTFLEPWECERLLSPLDQGGTERTRQMVLVALRTGLRIGELLALEWSDIDLDRRVLTVRRSSYQRIVTSPKSNKIRHVPLTSDVCEMLSPRRQLDGLLFTTRDGTPLTHESARWSLRRLCRLAGVRMIGWHALRHSFASHLVMRGVSLRAVQELLGHGDLRMTLRYAHLSSSTLREAVSVLEPSNSGHPVGNAPSAALVPAIPPASESSANTRRTPSAPNVAA